MPIKLVQVEGPDNIMHSSPFIVMCLVTIFPSLESRSQRAISDLSVSLLNPLGSIKMNLKFLMLWLCIGPNLLTLSPQMTCSELNPESDLSRETPQVNVELRVGTGL